MSASDGGSMQCSNWQCARASSAPGVALPGSASALSRVRPRAEGRGFGLGVGLPSSRPAPNPHLEEGGDEARDLGVLDDGADGGERRVGALLDARVRRGERVLREGGHDLRQR